MAQFHIEGDHVLPQVTATNASVLFRPTGNMTPIMPVEAGSIRAAAAPVNPLQTFNPARFCEGQLRQDLHTSTDSLA
jgi:hypothetical protein